MGLGLKIFGYIGAAGVIEGFIEQNAGIIKY